MKMKEFRALNYDGASFKFKSRDHRDEQIIAVKHIDHMSHIMGMDISDLDLNPYFVDPERFFITDKNKINYILSEIKSQTADKTSDIPVMTDSLNKIIDDIASFVKSHHHNEIAECTGRFKEDKTSCVDAITLLMCEYGDKQREHRDINYRLDKLKTIEPIDLSKQLADILSGGWWTDPCVEREGEEEDLDYDAPCFISMATPPITLRELDSRKGINRLVQMGRYKMCVYVKVFGFDIKINPHKDNPVSSSFFHPHVGSEGQICYGSEKILAQELSNAFDLVAIVDIIKQILTKYCPDNPYEHLHCFEKSFLAGKFYRTEAAEEEDDAGDSAESDGPASTEETFDQTRASVVARGGDV